MVPYGRRLVVVALLVLLAGCGDDEGTAASTTTTTTTSSTTTTAPAVRCSASGLERPAPQQGLPVPVADRRDDILDAALACDYDRLGELAAAGDGQLSYSFGGPHPGGFAGHLREREAAGEDLLALLVRTLGLPSASAEGFVVWPSAHQQAPSHADWEAVRPLYGDEAIDEMIASGSGFLGYRVGITPAGDWQYFVGGD
jgi:hypothetical protein